MINRMNGELANDFGNLAQRVLSMINKNCEAMVPEPGPITGDDDKLLGPARGLYAAVSGCLDRQAFHEALESIWVVIRAANGYVDAQAPWALRKEDPDRMKTVLYVLAETIRHLAILAQPFMPATTARMLDQLGIPEDHRNFSCLGADNALKPGTVLPKPEGVFPRFVEDNEEGAN